MRSKMAARSSDCCGVAVLVGLRVVSDSLVSSWSFRLGAELASASEIKDDDSP